MLLRQIKNAFTQLGQYLLSDDEQLLSLVKASHHYNAWFTEDQVLHAVRALGTMLNEQEVEKWIDDAYAGREETHTPKVVGLVLAGNIPLVGFHDILTVLASGHKASVKLSSQDKHLTPHILRRLVDFCPELGNRIVYIERLKEFDAVIATGSNNTSRYFEFYFKSVPHIIRRNRNSVAVLDGTETKEDIVALGHDIFDYFGLGCRNVSKLLVPKGYDFVPFFEAIEEPFRGVANHHKYVNNYDYNKSIYLVNGAKHLDNGFLLLKQDEGLASPLAVLFFEEYNDQADAEAKLAAVSEQIQCVVAKNPLSWNGQVVGLGCSQRPRLWDYADGVDTFAFLLGI